MKLIMASSDAMIESSSQVPPQTGCHQRLCPLDHEWNAQDRRGCGEIIRPAKPNPGAIACLESDKDA